MPIKVSSPTPPPIDPSMAGGPNKPSPVGGTQPQPQSQPQPQPQPAPQDAPQQPEPTTTTPPKLKVEPPRIDLKVKSAPTTLPTRPGSPVDKPDALVNGKQPGLSYVDMWRKLNPYTPPTPKEIEKEKKKQKREAIISAIGDGLTAFSNLYYTTQYAPNAYDPSKGLSVKMKERWDKLKKDRENNQGAYLDGLLRSMQMDSAEENQRWGRAHTLEREKKADELNDAREKRAQAKEEREQLAFAQKQATGLLQQKLLQGKIDYQNAKVVQAEIEAATSPEKIQAEINRLNRMGTGGGGGGKGRPPRYPWYDSNGERHLAYDYEEMRQNSLDHGTWDPETETSVTTKKDARGRVRGTTERQKPVKGHSVKPKPKTESKPAPSQPAPQAEAPKQPPKKGEDGYGANTKKLGV